MRSALLSHRGDDGLTLIELVIAVAILTFGVVTALTVLVHAQSSSNATTAKTMALNSAQEQLESIFQDDPSNVLTYNGFRFFVGDLAGAGPAGEPGLITVAATDPRPITITVAWQGQGTQPAGQITLTALRSEAAR